VKVGFSAPRQTATMPATLVSHVAPHARLQMACCWLDRTGCSTLVPLHSSSAPCSVQTAGAPASTRSASERIPTNPILVVDHDEPLT